MAAEDNAEEIPAWRQHVVAATWENDYVAFATGTFSSTRLGKRYPRFERYLLRAPSRTANRAEPPSTLSAGSRSPTRRSVRDFDREMRIRLTDLRQILLALCLEGQHFPFASAGGIYGSEVYLFAVHVESLPECVLFHLMKDEAMLERLWAEPNLGAAAFPTQTWVRRAPMVVIITADIGPYFEKYGERGYSFAMQEVGAIAHRVVESAEAVGLSCCIVGGFRDQAIRDALDLSDDSTEQCLCLIAVGHERC